MLADVTIEIRLHSLNLGNPGFGGRFCERLPFSTFVRSIEAVPVTPSGSLRLWPFLAVSGRPWTWSAGVGASGRP